MVSRLAGDQGLHDRRHHLRPLGNEHRIRAARRLRDHLGRPCIMARVERVAFERDDAPALARHHLLEFALDHVAIGALRQHRRERPLAAGDGVIDDAIDVGFRQEAQQIDTARRDAGVGGEGDDRHAALAGGRADDADRMREQRPDDDLGALGQRLLRRLLRAAGGAAVILDQELDVRAWNSASAISAAFFIDSATVPALPAADSGRISPTLTGPVPIAAGLLHRRRRAERCC